MNLNNFLCLYFQRIFTLQNPLFVHEVDDATAFVPLLQFDILKGVLQSAVWQQVVVIPPVVPAVQELAHEYW